MNSSELFANLSRFAGCGNIREVTGKRPAADGNQNFYVRMLFLILVKLIKVSSQGLIPRISGKYISVAAQESNTPIVPSAAGLAKA